MRNGLHYPAVMRKLAETRGAVRQRVLDVGCGDGLLDRMLVADADRHVTGFDSSPEYIAIARQEEQLKSLGIQYHLARADEFTTQERFDDAVSVMVLPYAPDAAYLTHFFRAACAPLESNGRFSSVTFNPAFKAFEERIGNRMFTLTPEGKVQVHFLDPESKQPVWDQKAKPIILTQFTQKEYERAAHEGGFSKVEWEKLYPTEEARKKLGQEFWEKCELEQPYALLVATK